MTFSSPVFMFLFLPIVLALYWVAGLKWRNLFLVIASIVFYKFADNYGVVPFLILIILNYILGIYVDKLRNTSFSSISLWIAVGINLGALAWFKYDEIIVSTLNMILKPTTLSLPPVKLHPVPLGISFFTFTAISYVIDVYREETKPQRNLTEFALFISIFPKIIAGPIVRYPEITNEIPDRKINLDQVAYGVKRFVFGLGKKILIADTLAVTVDQIFRIPTHELATSIAWLGIVTYTLQIYIDFSGYTDMAIGLGNMFGFKFQENFNYPYISKSLTEFWRRWHITLSTWLRDYLFIPMSHALMTDRIRQKISKGEYKINYRTVFSIITVFSLCGLWHGAGVKFLAWGMLHGLVIAVESIWLTKIMKRWWVPLQHVYFIIMIMVTWVFFRSPTLIDALGYLKAITGFSNSSVINSNPLLYFNVTFSLALLIALLISLPFSVRIKEYIDTERYRKLAAAIELMCIVIIMFLSFISIATSTFNPFIYQSF